MIIKVAASIACVCFLFGWSVVEGSREVTCSCGVEPDSDNTERGPPGVPGKRGGMGLPGLKGEPGEKGDLGEPGNSSSEIAQLRSIMEVMQRKLEEQQSIIQLITNSVFETKQATCSSQGDNFSEEIYVINCPAYCAQQSGSIWGTAAYTSGSKLCKAAVHDGNIEDSVGGRVVVLRQPGRNSYLSTTQNGVTSSAYGSWGQSYSFQVFNM